MVDSVLTFKLLYILIIVFLIKGVICFTVLALKNILLLAIFYVRVLAVSCEGISHEVHGDKLKTDKRFYHALKPYSCVYGVVKP